MRIIGVDFLLPEPRVIIGLPDKTKTILAGDLDSLTELAQPDHKDLVRAVYRIGFTYGDHCIRKIFTPKITPYFPEDP